MKRKKKSPSLCRLSLDRVTRWPGWEPLWPCLKAWGCCHACLCALGTPYRTILGQMLSSENMCANLAGYSFISGSNPSSNWHELPPTQWSRGVVGGRPAGPRHLAGWPTVKSSEHQSLWPSPPRSSQRSCYTRHRACLL